MILALVALSAISTTTSVLLLLALRRVEHDKAYAANAAAVANERLIQARKEGYEIPDTPVEATPRDDFALTPELEQLVLDWEGEAAQAAQRRVIRKYLGEGKGPAEVYRLLAPAEAIGA